MPLYAVAVLNDTETTYHALASQAFAMLLLPVEQLRA